LSYFLLPQLLSVPFVLTNESVGDITLTTWTGTVDDVMIPQWIDLFFAMVGKKLFLFVCHKLCLLHNFDEMQWECSKCLVESFGL